MECNKSVMTTILAGVILSWGLLLSADDHKQIVIDMKEFKVSENEFQAYLDSTGLGAMMSNDQGELIGGLFWSDAAWIMWQKNEASCITVGLFDTDSGVKRCEHGAQSAECLQRAA